MAKSNTHKQQHFSQMPLMSIDCGSSSFKLLVAEPTDPNHPDGSPLRILASEESSKHRCVHKGIIENTSYAGFMFNESVKFISNRLHRSEEDFPVAFTLLGGKTMRCAQVTAKRSQGKRMPISRNLLDKLRQECMLKVNNAKSEKPVVALEARPISYMLDEERTSLNPVGEHATIVEGTFTAFYGMPELKDKVQGTFDRAGKVMEGAFARPSALLEALADEKDEQLGVCIIDMGAETTTISIYKDGQFLTCRVMPMGGQHITSDIQQQGISMADAEKLKLLFGSAFEQPEGAKTIRIRSVKPDGEPVLIKTDFLAHIIVSRLDEMMQSIFAELKRYEDSIGRVYVTGGASRLKDIIPYIQQHTMLPVSYGSHADWLDEDTDDRYYGPEYSAAIGALLLGAKQRREEPGKLVGDRPIKPDGLFNRLRGLFEQEIDY